MKIDLTSTYRPLRSSISYHALRSRVIDLVAEKGEDYRGYPGAYFREDNKPGCLLGELIAEDGGSAHDLRMVGANKANVSDLNAAGYLIPEDNKVGFALQRLQYFNDSGRTWFDAACSVFGMTAVELRTEIAARLRPEPRVDAEAYVDWVSSYSEGAEKPVIDMSLPVHAPVAPHVLAA